MNGDLSMMLGLQGFVSPVLSSDIRSCRSACMRTDRQIGGRQIGLR